MAGDTRVLVSLCNASSLRRPSLMITQAGVSSDTGTSSGFSSGARIVRVRRLAISHAPVQSLFGMALDDTPNKEYLSALVERSQTNGADSVGMLGNTTRASTLMVDFSDALLTCMH